ncbi:MAG: GSCFA domain-containing protein [Bacteroidia bacterium]|nr:GSCFA domain-containing protein [Bacteroidia bacterium]
MLESFETFYQSLMQFNPASHIILTVSPVRHLKDTLVLNSVSKSVLRLACHTLSTRHNNVHYFPSYEIMIDDLRDYRFYKSDMIHPTEQAESMIWDQFAPCYFDAPTRRFLAEWTSLRASLSHRPFHPSSAGHQQFLKKLLQRLEELNSHVDVNSEIADVKSRLI